jgi:hypothetical protein
VVLEFGAFGTVSVLVPLTTTGGIERSNRRENGSIESDAISITQWLE